MSRSHRDQSEAYLNDLCSYCGARSVSELKRRHIQTWMEKHEGWKSQATHRGVIAIVQAAVNQRHRLPDMRINREVDADIFAGKQTELRDRIEDLKLQLDVVDRRFRGVRRRSPPRPRESLGPVAAFCRLSITHDDVCVNGESKSPRLPQQFGAARPAVQQQSSP
jgi:hypothetical protein